MMCPLFWHPTAPRKVTKVPTYYTYVVTSVMIQKAATAIFLEKQIGLVSLSLHSFLSPSEIATSLHPNDIHHHLLLLCHTTPLFTLLFPHHTDMSEEQQQQQQRCLIISALVLAYIGMCRNLAEIIVINVKHWYIEVVLIKTKPMKWWCTRKSFLYLLPCFRQKVKIFFMFAFAKKGKRVEI